MVVMSGVRLLPRSSTLQRCVTQALRSSEGSDAASRTVRPGFQRCLHDSSRQRQQRDQRTPLAGYYADILDDIPDMTAFRRAPRTVQRSPSTPTTTSPAKKEGQVERAPLLFASRLAGPERRAHLDSESRIVAGIKVPPKPEEPENCCMSGCVNCVWDAYREDLEEWAAVNTMAEAKLAAQRRNDRSKGKGLLDGPLHNARDDKNIPVHVAVSMDDDGGGSETNWDDMDVKVKAEDLFKNIPVGIREFMRTEKMLKQRHAQDVSTGR